MPLTFLASQEDIALIGSEPLEQIAAAYSEEYPQQSFSVELEVVDSKAIQALNKEYRALDEPTDVLSFPTYADTQAVLEAGRAFSALIGTVVICPEKTALYEETLPQMVHHGVLHLFGYDHETDRPSWNLAERRILDTLANKNLNIPPVPYE